MALGFKAKVRRTYPLRDQRVLVLESKLEGDVANGDWVEVGVPSGGWARARIESMAWSSAFRAEEAPLTLVVSGIGAEEPGAGADVRGIEAPDE
jgi:hypothetical protein